MIRKTKNRFSKYVRALLKIVLYTVSLSVALFLLLLILLQIPAVQNLAKTKTVAYLEGKLHTKVKLDKILIELPKNIVLQGIYFEDQKHDTLLFGKKIAVDISLLKLFNNKVEINAVNLYNVTSKISRNSHAVFNFDYIVRAFSNSKQPQVGATPMIFSINKINLNKVIFTFVDDLNKNSIYANINHFDTQVKKFDLNKMDFEIPNATSNGLVLYVKQEIQTKINKVSNELNSKKVTDLLKIKIGTVTTANSTIRYQNDNLKLTSHFISKKMAIAFDLIDLKNKQINIKTVSVEGTKLSSTFGKKKTNTALIRAVAQTPTPNWKIKVTTAKGTNLNFKFSDQNFSKLKSGIDYKHLSINNFNFLINKVSYHPKASSATIKQFSFKEQNSGLELEALRTHCYFGENGVSLDNFYLKTPQTIIKNKIIVGYPSIQAIKKNSGLLQINTIITGSKIGLRDVLLFAPVLVNNDLFRKNPNGVLNISGKISGKLNALSIQKLEIDGIGATKIDASGTVFGLPNYKTAYYNFKIKNIASSATAVALFLPRATVPSSISLPTNFSANGIFKGTITNFAANLNINSSFGAAKMKVLFDRSKKNNENYNATLNLKNFDVGKLIKNNSVGQITATTAITGKRLNAKAANAVVKVLVDKARYNNYTYNNVKVNGFIKNGKFKVNANANDLNLTFDMISNGSFQGKYPSVKLHLNIDIADLNKLNLHAGPLKIRGAVDADIQSANVDFLNAKIHTSKFVVANDKEQFVLDSISFSAVAKNKSNKIRLKSQFLNAEIDGKFKLSQLQRSIQNSIYKYYKNENYKNRSALKQQFILKIDVKESPLLYKLIPNLTSSSPFSIAGRYNSVNDTIVFRGAIPKIIYDNNSISAAQFSIETKNNAIFYNAAVSDFENANFQLPNILFYGQIKNNVVDYALQLKDVKSKERYFVSGSLKSESGNSDFVLNPKNLVLDYQNWNLSKQNLIRYNKNGLYIANFELSKSNTSLSVQSQSTQSKAPLEVAFNDFQIETFTNSIQKSKLQIGGKLNGKALITQIVTKPTFTANVLIEQFSVQKDTVGNLKVYVDNLQKNTYQAKAELFGFENQVHLEGVYNDLKSSFSGNVDIQKLNTKSIQGFSFGNLTESSGFLNGVIKIFGTTQKPKLTGYLKFNEVGFKVKQLNAKFKSINDKIIFLESTIAFKNFEIKDESNNNLAINGIMNNDDWSNLAFNLKVDAVNFKVVNSTAKDNESFYGALFLDNHLTINGTTNNPIVDGTIKINKDTKFTIVIPQADPSIADREGVVEFIDQNQPVVFKTLNFKKELIQSTIKGVLASAAIEIDKEAELSIIIDKSNGDFLKLKGEAQLTGGIDASGKTSLTGRYEVVEGTYEMNFNLIKRKFDIKNGGYILWTGEPTSADVNITAVYKSKTAPLDLVNDQLGTISAEVRNTYKQKIPFNTELKLSGDLLKPIISFDIVLPDGNNDVSAVVITTTQAKLAQLRQQPNELNKQVFALLLLNRFVGENPFSSESGGVTAAGFARESASKILSQQLNNFAEDLISGVELNFDLQSTEAYFTGQKQNKTDLNVGISKNLLNDRLKVTVGSSFGIEGEKQANQKANTIAGDVAVDYQITKDGRYKVRAYRLNKYQVALQGEVVETGVAFILTVDYNRFRELFQKRKLKTPKLLKTN